VDRLVSVVLFAGLGCFALAFLLSGVYPWAITDGRHVETSIEDLAARVTPEFRQMKEQYPVAFAEAFPEAALALTAAELAGLAPDDPRRERSEAAWRAAHAKALRDGRDLYVAEACWHCHSQYVRPVANEERRFGPVRSARHYDTALDRPVLFGTRRIGPDLTNEGGLRTNDWHVAHLHDPRSTSPDSVMPAYTWYFREGWQVRRRVPPAAVERLGVDPSASHPLPGVHATEAAARAEMERIAATLPTYLEHERPRLFVDRGIGPTGEALSLVAYLQWLGTHVPDEEVRP
jgi:cbb3-type cytochrome c oxidase subunit II